ncbi:MAG: porin family protein [Bacteroidales bacterium]
MKKILTLISVSLLLMTTTLNAKPLKLGITGGLNLSSMHMNSAVLNDVSKNFTGFNIGLALKADLPFGFVLQPAILYSQEGSKLEIPTVDDITYKTGSITIPVAIQWGIGLGPARIFAQAVPYAGIAVSNVIEQGTDSFTDSDYFEKFKYGFGLGAGVEFLNIQVSFRYNWELSNNIKDFANYSQLNNAKLKGATISAAFFF